MSKKVGHFWRGGGEMRRHRRVWDPFEEMRRMFSGGFGEDSFEEGVSSLRQPLADVWENKDSYTASIEMPGIRKEDIKIDVADNGLEIKAQRKSGEEKRGKNYYVVERNYSGFYKYVAFPEDAELEKARAKYDSGVLEISVPKNKEKEASKKRIKIN